MVGRLESWTRSDVIPVCVKNVLTCKPSLGLPPGGDLLLICFCHGLDHSSRMEGDTDIGTHCLTALKAGGRKFKQIGIISRNMQLIPTNLLVLKLEQRRTLSFFFFFYDYRNSSKIKRAAELKLLVARNFP